MYDILVPELRDDPLTRGYSGMTNEAILTSLLVKNRTKIVPTFGSFRTLASVLDDTEYGTVKATLTAAAAQSPKIADMLIMLNLPGDEAGNAGGIDMSNALVRGMVDTLFSETIASKMKAVAEILISRAEELGIFGIELTHIESAKTMY
jgi:hypothetical protein